MAVPATVVPVIPTIMIEPAVMVAIVMSAVIAVMIAIESPAFVAIAVSIAVMALVSIAVPVMVPIGHILLYNLS